MDWATIQTALVLAVQTALGDLTADVSWTNRETAWRSDSNVKLIVLSNTARGRGERRYTVEGQNLEQRERVYGPRRLVISIQCETQDQDLDASSLATAENIAAGLYQSDVEAILDTAGIGISKVEAVRQVDAPDAEGRVRSIAVLDVFFNAHASKVGPLIPYVETVIDPVGTITA